MKESICTSETIDQLSAFEETFFYRLMVNCDDYGLMDARPVILKSRLFPLKEIRVQQIEDALRKLTSAELVSTYEVNGKPFLMMNTWDKHQRIRAARGKYPGPDGSIPFGGKRPSPADIMTAHDNICQQMMAHDNICPRNPIQSESNPNPKEEGERARADAPSEPSAADMSAAQYCDMCLRGMSPGNYEELRSFMDEDGLPDDLIKFAVDDACGHGKRAWSYVCKILNRYVTEGIRTVDQARAGRKDAEAANENQPPQAAKGWGGDL